MWCFRKPEFWEVIRVRSGHEGGPCDGISVLIKKGRHQNSPLSLFLFCEDTVSLLPSANPGIRLDSTSVLGFRCPGINVCGLNPQSVVFCYGHQNWLRYTTSSLRSQPSGCNPWVRLSQGAMWQISLVHVSQHSATFILPSPLWTQSDGKGNGSTAGLEQQAFPYLYHIPNSLK